MQTLKFNVGDRLTIELTGQDPREFWPAAAFWLSLPTQCGFTGCNAALVLEYTTPKTYKYYCLKCTGPTPHRIQLGQKQDDGSLYYDRKKPWEVFRPGMTEDESADSNAGDQMTAHPNAPTSDKGKLIQTIREQYNACEIRRVKGYERVNLNRLGEQTVDELQRCSNYLHGLLNGNALPTSIGTPPPARPAPTPDDDIPF